MVIWKSERTSSIVGAVDLVDQQHRRRRHADRLQERPAQQEFLLENVALLFLGRDRLALPDLDGEKLRLIVPLVDRCVGVQPFVALQADQRPAEHRGEGLGDLGLADAGLAFEHQRPLQALHQQDRGGELRVRNVPGLGKTPLQRLTLVAILVRHWVAYPFRCLHRRRDLILRDGPLFAARTRRLAAAARRGGPPQHEVPTPVSSC
jgi:hypothetical protein